MSCPTWRRIESSGVISKSPVRVGTIIVTPDSTHECEITLYDGESTDDPRICKLLIYKSDTEVFTFTPYLVTQRGLYADFEDEPEDFLIQFERESQL